MAEYISEGKPLGGLIFLLPQMFNFENKGGTGSDHEDGSKELLKDVLAELEQILIRTNLPVSKFQKATRLLLYPDCCNYISFGISYNKMFATWKSVEKVNCLVHNYEFLYIIIVFFPLLFHQVILYSLE